jgi:serine/threonine protein kinase
MEYSGHPPSSIAGGDPRYWGPMIERPKAPPPIPQGYFTSYPAFLPSDYIRKPSDQRPGYKNTNARNTTQASIPHSIGSLPIGLTYPQPQSSRSYGRRDAAHGQAYTSAPAYEKSNWLGYFSNRLMEHPDPSAAARGLTVSLRNRPGAKMRKGHGWQVGFHCNLEPGQAEGLFDEIRNLGQGQLGFVQEVRIKAATESVVRKTVFLRPGADGRRKKAILTKEAMTLKMMDHPHIVQFIGSYDGRSRKGQGFLRSSSLLMDPVGDQDLAEFLATVSQPLSAEHEKWLASWFSCLASALAYMHSKGIRHEDIKPSNIIHRGSRIFFTDFSSATTFTVGSTTSTEGWVATTLRYAAPEMIQQFLSGNTLRHGRGTDVFSLACVFVEMLVTLDGKSVEEFQASSEKPAEGVSSFVYGHASDVMDMFFSSKERRSMYQGVYSQVIRPMLSKERNERPSAVTVLHRLQGSTVKAFPCECLYPYGYMVNTPRILEEAYWVGFLSALAQGRIMQTPGQRGTFVGLSSSPSRNPSAISAASHIAQPGFPPIQLHCKRCNKFPGGFRGPRELQTHLERCHMKLRTVFICVEATPDGTLLANCRACKKKQPYGTNERAAVHLRKVHFDPRKRDQPFGAGRRWPSWQFLKNHISELSILVLQDGNFDVPMADNGIPNNSFQSVIDFADFESSWRKVGEAKLTSTSANLSLDTHATTAPLSVSLASRNTV